MVEFCSIGSLLERKRTKAKDKYNKEPVYAVTNNQGFVLSSSLHDFNIFSEDTSNYMVVCHNDFAYNPSRLNIGSIAYFKEEGIGLISPMYVVFHANEKKVLAEYLYIVIKSESVLNKIDTLKEVGARFRFDFSRWNLIQIPIPSLSEQERIVGILDTFTSAIDNLKEQIAQRRKQYEFYRDQLLDLEGKEGVEMKTLGEVCDVTDYVANGSFASLRENVEYKQELDYAILVRTVDLSQNFEGDKIYINKKAYEFLSKSSLKGGEIIINNIGAGVGSTFRCPFLNMKMSLGPNSIMVKTPNNDFYYYWFSSIYGQTAMMKIVTPGAMPKFNKTGFKTITIPLPSLEEQQRIVSILDTFEASISNLEAQLKQREKQYEYYRNKLLTFE